MWDLIVSVPDHCLSFYFRDNFIKNGKKGSTYHAGKLFIKKSHRLVFNPI